MNSSRSYRKLMVAAQDGEYVDKMTDTKEKGLKLNRQLLNPNFEGYKLSLDPIPSYKAPLASPPDEVKLHDHQFSYQHVKAFAVHNHLFLDPYNDLSVYYISDWKLMHIRVENGHSISNADVVFEFPDVSNQKLSPNRLHPCVKFLNSDWLSLSDGAGRLYLIWTGNRQDGLTWKICYSNESIENNSSFIMKDSVMYNNGENHCVDFILLNVDPVDKDDSNSTFQTVIEWISISSADRSHWELCRTRRLTGSVPVDYISLQTDGKAIYIASEKPYKIVFDSLKPVVIANKKTPVKSADDLPSYTWTQTSEDVTIQFSLSQTCNKSDITFKLMSDNIELSVNGIGNLLNGKLHDSIDIEASTWTIQQNRLEVILGKKEESVWPVVVVGDDRGKLMENMDEKMQKDTNDDDEDENKKPYNTQQLEDCDEYPDELSALVRFDGEEHVITHQADLSCHQWLFNATLSNDKIPAVCLRHDVDGILWQPQDYASTVESPWIHNGTFNALGYVKASKQQNKFTTCSPDMSFAVLCDCVRHIYVYRQCSPTLTPLRNRKTGKSVSAIAKQQLVTLECTDTILGMQTTNERIYVLTTKNLYMIQVIEQSV